MTLPEGLLWRELRKRPGGFKFRRQHPAGDYVLDFYCAAVRLAVEVDGFAHDTARVAVADKRRSDWLRSQHVATTRIPAKAILEDLNVVVVRVVEICQQRVKRRLENPPVPLHHPAPTAQFTLSAAAKPQAEGDGPPPRAGEEL